MGVPSGSDWDQIGNMSGLDQDRVEFRLRLDQVWIRFGSGLDQVWIRFGLVDIGGSDLWIGLGRLDLIVISSRCDFNII